MDNMTTQDMRGPFRIRRVTDGVAIEQSARVDYYDAVDAARKLAYGGDFDVVDARTGDKLFRSWADYGYMGEESVCLMAVVIRGERRSSRIEKFRVESAAPAVRKDVFGMKREFPAADLPHVLLALTEWGCRVEMRTVSVDEWMVKR